MPWLIKEGTVLATLDIPSSAVARSKGLVGKSGYEGAILLRPCRAIHTFGLKFDLDVAYCDKAMVVLEICTVKPRRACMPRLRAGSVLEAASGSFERWGLRVGDCLEIKQ